MVVGAVLGVGFWFISLTGDAPAKRGRPSVGQRITDDQLIRARCAALGLIYALTAWRPTFFTFS